MVVVALRPSGERSGIAVISTVSHELRSPLTSVKGYTSLMLSRWDRLKDEQKRSMLEQVHHDADRVTRLVTELLDISRLETGRLVLRRQLVDLPALAGVGGGEGRHGRSTTSTARSRFADDFPRVYADPDKVEQVLTNLVENAAKYGSPARDGGRRARPTTAWWRSPCATPARASRPTTCPGCSRKFFRRDHGRPNGTGLGLWISRGPGRGPRRRAHRHVRRSGQGSTFRFTLPIDAVDALSTRNRLASG